MIFNGISTQIVLIIHGHPLSTDQADQTMTGSTIHRAFPVLMNTPQTYCVLGVISCSGCPELELNALSPYF